MRLPTRRIGLANWTPEGLVGQAQKAFSRPAPPAGGKAVGPLGAEERLRELFGEGIAGLEVRRREFTFRSRSAEDWLAFFRTNFGSLKMAFERLDDEGRKALAADARVVLERFNRAGSRALAVPAEYVEAVATRA